MHKGKGKRGIDRSHLKILVIYDAEAGKMSPSPQGVMKVLVKFFVNRS